MAWPSKRLVRRVLGGAAALGLLIQLVPFGREHANPPVRQVAPWPDERTRALATRACFDCHSNLTHWAWYTSVAPISWAVQRDVYAAREKMNFTEWDRSQQIEKAPELVLSGEMPLPLFLLTHPEARLTQDERRLLAQGLEALAETEGGDRDDNRERDGGGSGRDGDGGRDGGGGGSGRSSP
jgi:hypothetical protein